MLAFAVAFFPITVIAINFFNILHWLFVGP